MIRGAAGIGKTALLDNCVSRAIDMRVERIVGIESEMSLGFSGLHQLLRTMLGELEALPAPQRAGLESIFGMTSDGANDPLLLRLATLSLVSAVATDRPLLCIIDDAQWLDPESAAVLGFVARRLHAEGVVMLVAIRDGSEEGSEFLSLPHIELRGLTAAAAESLLNSATEGRLLPRERQEIVRDTGGNPLALRELAAELTLERLTEGTSLMEPPPLSRRIEEKFLRDVRDLPGDAQLLMLLVAAQPAGDPTPFWRSVEQLELGPEASRRAEATGLLQSGVTMRFRHPLVRSAVYHGATDADRRLVHDALAASSDRVFDADRYAWHRSASVLGGDEEIAQDLEESARRAQIRNSTPSAAAFQLRAARLTPDPATSARRLLSAASLYCEAGASQRALGLFNEATAVAAATLEPADVLRIRGVIGIGLNEAAGTPGLLVRAAAALAAHDVRAARSTLLDAYTAGLVCGDLATDTNLIDVTDAIRGTPLPPGTPQLLEDHVLAVLCVAVDDDYVTVRTEAAVVMEMLGDPADPVSVDLRSADLARLATAAACDLDSYRMLLTALAVRCRESGAAVVLRRTLNALADIELLMGSVTEAERHLEARRSLVAPRAEGVDVEAVLCAAARGDVAAARDGEAAARRMAIERSEGWITWRLDWAMYELELGLGDFRAARGHAEAMLRSYDVMHDLLHGAFGLSAVVESAMRDGDRATADAVLARYTPLATACGTPLTLGLLARSRAVASDDPSEVELEYAEALRHLTGLGATYQVARTELMFGEWLRRARRRKDAREHLRSARDLFEGAGRTSFAERAQLELSATGETARSRDDDERFDLTPQETHCAVLAARGATNNQIAMELFLSPRTVEYHLSKVFRKLDVTTRQELVGHRALTV